MSGRPDDFDRDDPDREEREQGRGDRRDDEDDVRVAKSRVTVPAVGLIAIGALMLVAVVLNLVQFGSLDTAFDEQVKNIENNPQLTADQKKEQVQVMNQIRDWVKTGFLPYIGLIGVFAIIIILGGVKLMNLGSPGLVYLSSILVLLPCTICCVPGLVFGIWAMVAMGKPEVKAGFAAKRRLSSSPDSY